VGAFDRGIEVLQEAGLVSFIRSAVADGHQLLGICLGMQLLARGSEEGARQGLGLIEADVRRIRPAVSSLRVPHMGWNIVRPARENSLLPVGEEEQRFYFVHSYHMICDRPSEVLATTEYGGDIVSAVAQGQVWGVQFHPEKSHRFGKALLERFATMEPVDA
jgi:glutamine amidotransferase